VAIDRVAIDFASADLPMPMIPARTALRLVKPSTLPLL
jgi:hypothetical protein